MIKYGKCEHCNCDVVVGSDNEHKGHENGVEPVWIWNMNKKDFERNYDEKFLCLECANTRISK